MYITDAPTRAAQSARSQCVSREVVVKTIRSPEKKTVHALSD
jgi:hypothetical protein